MTVFNHLKNRNSAANPGFTAGFAVPIYNHTRNTARIQAIAYAQCTRNIMHNFNIAPKSDNHLLHKLEYQFFVFECMCGLGAIGVSSSSGVLGDTEFESTF